MFDGQCQIIGEGSLFKYKSEAHPYSCIITIPETSYFINMITVSNLYDRFQFIFQQISPSKFKMKQFIVQEIEILVFDKIE